jgi:Ca2+-binding RTX toxin-like protein
VVGTFLIGCALLLLLAVGCSGTRSEAPEEKQQGHTEATNTEQGRTAETTASEEVRCEGTRTYHRYYDYKAKKMRTGSEQDMKKAGKTVDWGVYTTNDLPGCPKGGLLLGTDKKDKLDGKDGDDQIRGLGGAKDHLFGGEGDDAIYGDEGSDSADGAKGDDVIYGGEDHDELGAGSGQDVIYGGDGNDFIYARWEDGQRDELYCGKGRDTYYVGKNNKKDLVSKDCEKEFKPWRGIP